MKKLIILLVSKAIGIFRGHKLSRFSLVRSLMKFFVFSLSPIEIPGGEKLFLHPSGIDYIIKPYEPFKAAIIKKLLKPGNVFWDVGAAVGFYTVIASKIVGPSGKVIAFEPAPEYCKLLRKNIARNNCQNVTVFQKAASNKNGKTRLYLYEQSGSNRIQEVHSLPASSIEIETLKIDDLADKDADFAKIDVEGAEYLVLEGMTNLLKKNERIKLLIELPEIKTLETLELLADCGFNLYEVIEEGNDLKEITDFARYLNYESTKYIFCEKTDKNI